MNVPLNKNKCIMLKQIKTKFIVFSIVIIVLTIGIPVFFLINQLQENFEQRNEFMILGTVDMLNSGLNYAMMQGFQKNVRHILEKIALNPNIERIRIFKEDGKISHSSDSTEIGKNMFNIAKKHIIKFRSEEKNIIKINNEGVYSVIVPVANKPECQDCHNEKQNIAYLDIDTDLTRAEVKFYTGISHMVFLGLTILILLIFSLYLLFTNLIHNPLVKLNNVIKEVTSGNLDVQVNYYKDDEIGYLTNSFNNMIKELKRSKEKIEELHFAELFRADKFITLGELASEMAHEINNHAAIISSRMEYLLMNFEDKPIFMPYKDDTEVILNRIKSISKITGNILKHAKKTKKDFVEINLVKIINDTIILFESLAKKRNIKIKSEIKTEKVTIKGDPVQIEQALTNLIKNALDASADGGEIIISIYEENNKLCLEIKDFGTGIDELNLVNIFNPFYTTKSEEKGTGLGLYIVKNICKNHNAEIKVKSRINEGTVFTIIFILEE